MFRPALSRALQTSARRALVGASVGATAYAAYTYGESSWNPECCTNASASRKRKRKGARGPPRFNEIQVGFKLTHT
jgi:hypothetical protein